MVFGHNLRYMAPFDFSRAGFCMVFRRASFVCSCPGAAFGARDLLLGPRDPNFGPGISQLGPGWPGEVFGPKMGPKKARFCEGMVSKIENMGFFCDHNGLYGTQEAFGQASFPPNP